MPRPALNAIPAYTLETDPAGESPEDRTARHLRVCQELLERGMRLARIASDRAEHDMEATPPSPMPGSAAAALEQAEASARLRTNYAMIFARLSRAVRQTVALQAHIAANRPFARIPQPSNANHRSSPTPRAQNRAQNGAECRLDVPDPPDWMLPAGPDSPVAVEAQLQTIRQAIGDIPPDNATPQTGPVAPAPHPVRLKGARPAEAAIRRPDRRW